MNCLKKKKEKYYPQETLWNKHLAWLFGNLDFRVNAFQDMSKMGE